jgi:predicted 3-demethylubiquinone-9 3-methyltransferase (glyoxalase superfamily)
MNKVTPFLWFDNNAHEAMDFYASVFPDAKVTSKFPQGGTFEIAGQQFMTLNGGPMYKFNEAISLYVNCDSQEEVDRLWAQLTADGGSESRCGWLKDKYGLSWQIIPSKMWDLLRDPDQEKISRVMAAMMQMSKINIAALQEAYDSK